MSPTARGAERITAVLTKIGLVGQGFHPPTKADALCAIPPRLGGEQYIHRRDAESAERRSAALTQPFGRGYTCRRKRTPRVMRQTRTGVNVSENCYK